MDKVTIEIIKDYRPKYGDGPVHTKGEILEMSPDSAAARVMWGIARIVHEADVEKLAPFLGGGVAEAAARPVEVAGDATEGGSEPGGEADGTKAPFGNGSSEQSADGPGTSGTGDPQTTELAQQSIVSGRDEDGKSVGEGTPDDPPEVEQAETQQTDVRAGPDTGSTGETVEQPNDPKAQGYPAKKRKRGKPGK